MPVTSVPFHNRFESDGKDPETGVIPIANGTRRDCYECVPKTTPLFYLPLLTLL